MQIVLSTPPSPANVAAIKAQPDDGRGAPVRHPRAGNAQARKILTRQLTAAGLKHRVAMTLHWVTSAPAEPELQSVVVPEPVWPELDDGEV